VAALLAVAKRPLAVWRALGDGWGAIATLTAAAMSANAQRAHPNINVFVISSFASAFFLRMTPRVFVLTKLAGAAVVVAAMEHFRADAMARRADEVAMCTLTALALAAFFLAEWMRVRVFVAHREVELLNDELERRVEAQVGEIRRRAREVEELNTQLNQRIAERSRELSRALARLAGGADALPRGAVLGGRVEIERWIGAGGMGVVYRGHDRVTGKTVAVKVLETSSARAVDALQRFLREARAMATVAHPAIVRSLHVDVADDGHLFQVMELVEGESLESRLARAGALPEGVVARLGAVLATALAAAHERGVVHRDVKPSNVMLTSEPPGLKLLDFGISAVRETGGAGGGDDGLLGTPEFSAPEQVNAPASVGPPADVYALGLVLFLCVAGRLPYAADTPHDWFINHLAEDPVDLATLAPGVDAELARAVMACLLKDPGARPTAADLATTLARLADAAHVAPLEALDLPRPSAPPPRVAWSRTTMPRRAVAEPSELPSEPSAPASLPSAVEASASEAPVGE
jgi:serine/threonine-protein kinase